MACHCHCCFRVGNTEEWTWCMCHRFVFIIRYVIFLPFCLAFYCFWFSCSLPYTTSSPVIGQACEECESKDGNKNGPRDSSNRPTRSTKRRERRRRDERRVMIQPPWILRFPTTTTTYVQLLLQSYVSSQLVSQVAVLLWYSSLLGVNVVRGIYRYS